MVVYHTKDGWWEYEMETNFAGGPAGAAYAKTTPSGAAELTPCNAPFNEEQTMPMAEYIHEAEEMAGQDISTKTVFTKGLKIIAGKIVQYMQNSIWLDLATGIVTMGGAFPSSKRPIYPENIYRDPAFPDTIWFGHYSGIIKWDISGQSITETIISDARPALPYYFSVSSMTLIKDETNERIFPELNN